MRTTVRPRIIPMIGACAAILAGACHADPQSQRPADNTSAGQTGSQTMGNGTSL